MRLATSLLGPVRPLALSELGRNWQFDLILLPRPDKHQDRIRTTPFAELLKLESGTQVLELTLLYRRFLACGEPLRVDIGQR